MKAVAGNFMIQTVSRSLEPLEQFQEGDAEFGITDLSRAGHHQHIPQPSKPRIKTRKPVTEPYGFGGLKTCCGTV